MKIAKRAEQKNFELNKDFCRVGKVVAIAEKYNGFFWKGSTVKMFRALDSMEEMEIVAENEDILIPADEIAVVKVALDECGYYVNVAVMKDGEEIYIRL